MTKKFIEKSTFLILAFSPSLLWAQGDGGGSFYDSLGVYLIGGLTIAVALGVILILVRLSEAVVKESDALIPRVQDDEQMSKTTESSEPMLQSIYRRLNKVVPVEREKEILLDHNYDGIKELDNILPPWWLWMFYISIAIGVVYFGYYHIAGKGLNSTEQYHAEMVAAEESVKAFLSTQSDEVDETNVEALVDDAALSAGQITFNTLCAVCHLESGAGSVGPNLTDKYWVHGGDIKDVFRTIKYGVPEKGMISWSSQLRPSQIQEVSSYILTLEGTNPENPKAPEGDLYEREKM